MKKNLLLRFCLILAAMLSLHSCRTEEELTSQNAESGNIQYGISQQAFLNSQFIDHLNSKSNSNAKSSVSAMTAEELASRLDLEKAHYSSHNGEEILHAPVRVFGSYKRSLLSISRNKVSRAFLLTYPNPEDHRLFYITDLSGNLLKEVRIGEDGKEITQTKSGKYATAGKSGDFCTETVFVTCSSGKHSFGMGNALECEFWNDPRGTPPNLFSINISCGEPSSPGGGGGGGFENPSDPSPGGSPGTGGTGPVNGGGPPKNGLTPSNCQQGLDCEDCNIPGDINNDCILSYDEAVAVNSPCTKIKAKFADTKFKEKVTAIDKPEVFDYDHEMGFAAGYPPANTGVTGTQYQPMENKLGSHSVSLPPGDHYFGFIHSHNNESNGGVPVKIFSPADLATFLTSCVAHADQHGSIGDAYAMVITSEGNYMLYFTGTSSGFGIGPNTIKWWKKWYKDHMDLIKNEDGSIDQDKVEKTFLRFLKEKVKINGIELYQVEKITGKAQKLTLDNNNAVKPVPCP